MNKDVTRMNVWDPKRGEKFRRRKEIRATERLKRHLT